MDIHRYHGPKSDAAGKQKVQASLRGLVGVPHSVLARLHPHKTSPRLPDVYRMGRGFFFLQKSWTGT